MPKKSTMPAIAKKQRKKNPPRTAFKKGGPNPHAFRKGENNPGGKRKTGDDLVGKWLAVDSSARAPDDVCRSLHLPLRSSFGRVLARRLMYFAMQGAPWAFAEIREYTQGSRSRVDLFGFGALDQNLEDVPPLLEIVFVDGVDGRPKEPVTIHAKPAELPETVD